MSAEACLAPLLNEIDGNIVYYEIGVLKGENLVALAKDCPRISKIVGIDSYKAYIDTFVGSYSVSYEGGQYNKSVAEQAIANSKYPNKIDLWIIDSHEAARQTIDKRIDVVFLDKGIQAKETILDILEWYPKVKDGGILCGHDWYCEGIQKEVYEALEQLGYSKDDVNVLGNEVWWIKKQ